jgi:hypothetical protein
LVKVKKELLVGHYSQFFSQRFSLEFDAVRSVHEPVEDGIGHGLFPDELVPAADWELGSNQGRAFTMPAFPA